MSGTIPATTQVPLLRCAGIGKTYPSPGAALTILHGLDLDIYPGELVSIMGRSGAGKSTLLNILGLLDEPSAGSYEIDGVATTTMTEKARSVFRGHTVGFVFQSFHLIPHHDALGNVMLPLRHTRLPRSQRLDRAHAALELVGLSDRIHARAGQLSGGERQRVAIARAIVHNPKLILCDEPTGNLDNDTAERVLDVLFGLPRNGHTVLIVTHDESVAARCDRTLRIDAGRLREHRGSGR
ncbi:ABC transporter ATP-binding protein [Phytoactinopolyspora limicola]|uniref:ABC transporter ATP-binding protein n=1 Tax=Phytoactinopolyspora limicola TaxID=2715536 RepID=UPI00140E7471|nr:ABC transporter ATP-binding protein [Phytoactinopolyspora limicola]